MLFAIRFTDHPTAFNVRKQYLHPHLEWLKQKRDVIKAAGSLREKHSDQPVGALWVVDAENEEDALSIFSDDPFWLYGLRASVEVLSWSLAFEDMLEESKKPA
ncbi:YciI family protein [Erwiniaceae bacterium BAC15a-03b]|uniref:YciI family protein n=1 Tax=Winslowiella arboricola TaxID=2978220 RepID=A0A9J6PKV4_9GAMM|nr:YciI family protein [Winslowiella arboricola]MCU5774398.1 YciI family protein [Winslowiella arboricola]MCU5778945.1 YciI family protein [Winslowiella arboricola]